MAVDKQFIDGTLALDAQEDTLNFMERVGFAKTINYTESPGDHPDGMKVNQATLDDVPLGQKVKPLHLEAVDDSASAASVIADQLRAGRVVVFHDTVFVSGEPTMVIGFR